MSDVRVTEAIFFSHRNNINLESHGRRGEEGQGKQQYLERVLSETEVCLKDSSGSEIPVVCVESTSASLQRTIRLSQTLLDSTLT